MGPGELIAILGRRVDAVEAGEAVERIAASRRRTGAADRRSLGVEMVMERSAIHASARSPIAARAVRYAAGILLVSRLRGGPLRSRVTGVDSSGRFRTLATRGDSALPVRGCSGAGASRH